MTELLTPAEHDAVAMAGELWNLLTGIVGDGPAREGDLRELIGHVHAIQQAVMKQAAARAYPEMYRLLGGHPAGTRESKLQIWNHDHGDPACPVCGDPPLPPERPAPLPDPVVPSP